MYSLVQVIIQEYERKVRYRFQDPLLFQVSLSNQPFLERARKRWLCPLAPCQRLDVVLVLTEAGEVEEGDNTGVVALPERLLSPDLESGALTLFGAAAPVPGLGAVPFLPLPAPAPAPGLLGAPGPGAIDPVVAEGREGGEGAGTLLPLFPACPPLPPFAEPLAKGLGRPGLAGPATDVAEGRAEVTELLPSCPPLPPFSGPPAEPLGLADAEAMEEETTAVLLAPLPLIPVLIGGPAEARGEPPGTLGTFG
jgi:hypothetical protein